MSNAVMARRVDDLASIDIESMPTEEILSLLEQTLQEIYAKVALAGMLLLGLEKRGFDMRTLRRRPLIESVRNVALGVLSKEAFAAYYERPELLRRMTAMPLEEQKKLVEKGEVEIIDFVDNKTTHRLVNLADIRREQLPVVFDAHRVRSVEEQAVMLSAERIKEKTLRAIISHDPRTGVICCKNATAPQIQAYIKKHGLA